MSSSDGQSTTKPPSTEPKVCKMGCGFFGSGDTEGCCSKCFLENQKKLGRVATLPAKKVGVPADAQAPQPMEVESCRSDTNISNEEPICIPVTEQTATVPVVLKKKKKKTSYKAMMAAMTTSKEKDIESEKESIRKHTGGGVFIKVDKI